MQASRYPWELTKYWRQCPSVGCLMDLCDENYHQLLRLAPGLHGLHGQFLSKTHRNIELSLEVLEQTPYTTLIHLTYYFESAAGRRLDPDALLRAYHDCRQVEVLKLEQAGLPLDRSGVEVGLERKWRVNLFLSKWLAYCVRDGHRFAAESLVEDRSVAV